MPQKFEVDYQIKVNADQARTAIDEFAIETQKLTQVVTRFDALNRSIGKLNAALISLSTHPVTINVKAHKAQSTLASLSKTLNGMRKNVTINVKYAGPKNFAAQMRQTHKAIDNINKRYINPKAQTTRAIKSLDLLLKKIQEVKANSKITITASAAGASGAVGGYAGRGGGGKPAPVFSRVTSRLPTMGKAIGNTTATSGGTFVGEMVRGMGVMYALSSVMSGVTQVFKDAADYQNISQTTKNILQSNDSSPDFEGKFNAVNKQMRQVGVETKFTAPQVASAGKFLAMAGLNVDQIGQSINPIANIALIGDTDLGETADVMTNIMTGYEIPANRMNNAADILTKTFTNSNTTLLSLAESFKYAGTVAHQSGMDFSETAAAIGVLGDAGIQGSHAGTTLRMMLMNMLNPTKKGAAAWKELGVSVRDANGDLRGLGDILADLKAKRDQMGNGEFQTLINKMFRVTAAPGAMALIQNADKVQRLTGQNENESYGLSEELADAKKNTVEGLWYQFTSAFTETGLQQFEGMQTVIRDFLKQMIALMKSDEFASGLRDMMSLMISTLKTVADMFQQIAKFWQALPNWAKTGLEYFIKIQLYVSVLFGALKSIASVGVGVFAVFSKVIRPIEIIVGLMTNWKNTMIALQLMGGGTGLKAGLRGLLMAGSGQAINAASTGGSFLARFSTAQQIGAAGQMGLLGSTLSGLGSIASFLFTNPVGWATMAVAAIGYIGYEIYDTIKATNAARKANEAWGQSYRMLGVDKMQLNSDEDYFIGNMRIANNELLSQNEQLVQSIELWKRYYDTKNQPKEDHSGDDTKYSESEAGKKFGWSSRLEQADQWFGVNTAFQPMLKELGTYIKPQDYLDSNGRGYRQYELNLFGRNFNLGQKDEISENLAVQMLLAQIGADYNSEQAVNFQKYTAQQIYGAHSYNDIQSTIASIQQNRINNMTWNPAYDWISSEAAGDLTVSQIQQSQMYVRGLQTVYQKILNEYDSFNDIIKDADANKVVEPSIIQQFLREKISPIFDAKYGVFGSEGWVGKMKDMVENPVKYGFTNTAQVTSMITSSFTELLNFYDLIDTKYKPLFASYLNRGLFTGILPANVALPEGGVTPGKKAGDTMTGEDGKTYTWSFKAPYSTYQWLDKNGNIYSPKNSKQTQTWTPTNAGGGGKGGKKWTDSLHNGSDQSKYNSHYKDNSAAPKQVIVNIGNLMKVDKQTIDMSDERQSAAVHNIKEQLATALLDVVQDFNANMS